MRAAPDCTLEIVRSAVRVCPSSAVPALTAAAVGAHPNRWKEVSLIDGSRGPSGKKESMTLTEAIVQTACQDRPELDFSRLLASVDTSLRNNSSPRNFGDPSQSPLTKPIPSPVSR